MIDQVNTNWGWVMPPAGPLERASGPRMGQAMMVEDDGHDNRLRQALLRPVSGAIAAGLINAIRVFSEAEKVA